MYVIIVMFLKGRGTSNLERFSGYASHRIAMLLPFVVQYFGESTGGWSHQHVPDLHSWWWSLASARVLDTSGGRKASLDLMIMRGLQLKFTSDPRIATIPTGNKCISNLGSGNGALVIGF